MPEREGRPWPERFDGAARQAFDAHVLVCEPCRLKALVMTDLCEVGAVLWRKVMESAVTYGR